jgi:hypothetical protein
MYRFVILCLALVASSYCGLENAVGITLDFESVPGVTPDPDFGDGGSAPASARLNNQLLSTFGVLFRTEIPNPDYIALINLGVGHATSGSIGIGSVNVADQNKYELPMLISFFDPANTSTMAVTDFVSIRGDLWPNGGMVTMQAFDPHGVLLGSTSLVDNGGTVLSLSVANIQSVRITETVSTVAWDDLTFNPLVPVPEPGSVVLLGLGAVALMFARRLRRVV